jgi:hypothetical protein
MNKKRVLFISSLFCVLPFFAQENPVSLFTSNNPHELKLSLGAFPITSNDEGYCFWEDDDAFEDEKGWSYLSKGVYSPAINLSYSYQLKSWLSLGAAITYSVLDKTYKNQLTDEMQFKKRRQFLAFTPSVRFDWYRMKYVRVYSGVGLGVAYYKKKDSFEEKNSCYGSVDITYLGMSVGRKWYGFGEMSIGTNGFFKIGVGYRFGLKN